MLEYDEIHLKNENPIKMQWSFDQVLSNLLSMKHGDYVYISHTDDVVNMYVGYYLGSYHAFIEPFHPMMQMLHVKCVDFRLLRDMSAYDKTYCHMIKATESKNGWWSQCVLVN